MTFFLVEMYLHPSTVKQTESSDLASDFKIVVIDFGKATIGRKMVKGIPSLSQKSVHIVHTTLI